MFKDVLREQGENDTNMLIVANKNENKKSKDTDANNKIEIKKKLSNKERKRLEKVLERKEKSAKRSELLEKLASVQIKTDELKLYKSVKDIGKKEKRKHYDEEENAYGFEGNLVSTDTITSGHQPNLLEKLEKSKPKGVVVNSIAGSNKRRKNNAIVADSNEEKSDSSIDTDDMSTDSEVDENVINQALEQFKKNQQEMREKCLKKSVEEYKSAKIDSDDETTNFNQLTNKKSFRVTKYVHVDRRDDIKESRSKLPIITEEQVIMEKINDNDITIICGETGSGKTTQVPQFLYEAGYAE